MRRTRPPTRRNRPGTPKNKEHQKGSTIINQSIACALILLVAIGIQAIDKNTSVAVSTNLKKMINKNITFSDVNDYITTFIKSNDVMASIFPVTGESFKLSVFNPFKQAQDESEAQNGQNTGQTENVANTNDKQEQNQTDQDRTHSNQDKATDAENVSTALEQNNGTNTLMKADGNELSKLIEGIIKNSGVQMSKRKPDEASRASPPGTGSSRDAPMLSYRLTVPVNGTVSSSFGVRTHPITKEEDTFHTGIDIAAPRGTPVKAVADGTVTETGKSEVYGSYIIIEHRDSISTFYGHCEKLNVKKGNKVKAGQTIASVGDTGMSTGNHLHFEIRKNKIAVNPEPLLWPS